MQWTANERESTSSRRRLAKPKSLPSIADVSNLDNMVRRGSTVRPSEGSAKRPHVALSRSGRLALRRTCGGMDRLWSFHACDAELHRRTRGVVASTRSRLELPRRGGSRSKSPFKAVARVRIPLAACTRSALPSGSGSTKERRRGDDPARASRSVDGADSAAERLLDAQCGVRKRGRLCCGDHVALGLRRHLVQERIEAITGHSH